MGLLRQAQPAASTPIRNSFQRREFVRRGTTGFQLQDLTLGDPLKLYPKLAQPQEKLQSNNFPNHLDLDHTVSYG